MVNSLEEIGKELKVIVEEFDKFVDKVDEEYDKKGAKSKPEKGEIFATNDGDISYAPILHVSWILITQYSLVKKQLSINSTFEVVSYSITVGTLSLLLLVLTKFCDEKIMAGILYSNSIFSLYYKNPLLRIKLRFWIK